MRRRLLALVALVVLPLLAAPAVQAGQKPARVLFDHWDVAFLQAGRAGYVHTYLEEFENETAKVLRGTVELRLAVKRFNEVTQVGMDTGTFESPDGRVLGVFMRQMLGKNKQLEITGLVKGDMLHLVLDQNKPLKPAPWNDQVLGVSAQQRLYEKKSVKPGDEFEYLAFEPSINLVLKHRVKALDYEAVELLGGKRQRLLKVRVQPEKVQNVQLPAQTLWLNEAGTPLRSEAEIPVFGKLTLFRASKEQALAPTTPAKFTDVGFNQLVKLSRPIVKAYDRPELTYRITIRDEEDPATAFIQDERQTITRVKGNTLELHVRAKGEAAGGFKFPGPQYLQSSYFLNSNDVRVKDLARKAIGIETDALKKALRIEKWVHGNMKGTNHEALATADHVARTLEGDCTEFAMLTSAMCRAVGVPSRTAVGLIYADTRQGPAFSFHMWSEVYAGGRWHPLDATLGRGGITAAHIKITDHAWEGRDFTPLLPVVRLLGRLSIEVVTSENR